MKYWQNNETGMVCAVAKQPSARHYEISKEAYEAHEKQANTSVQADTCPVCHGEDLISLRGDPVICYYCDGTGKRR